MPFNVVFACDARSTPESLTQAARLLMSLRWFGGSTADARFVLQCQGAIPNEADRLFRQYHAQVIQSPSGSAHACRIDLLKSAAIAGCELVVLLDPDSIIVGDPAEWLDRAGAAGLADGRECVEDPGRLVDPDAVVIDLRDTDETAAAPGGPCSMIVRGHAIAYPSGFLRAPPDHRREPIEAFNARLRASGHAQLPAAREGMANIKRSGRNGPKVIVGSGWWCDRDSHQWSIGSNRIRSIAFFDVWYRQVVRCFEPERIVVTDSAAPVKPDYRSYAGIEWVELDRNYGHPNDVRTGKVKTKYSGFTRSVISGAMYALCCDADYYVYVEQDCLVRGDRFLSRAIGDSTEDILLGPPTRNGQGLAGKTAAPMIQQSFMVVARSGLERFLQGLLGAPWSDGERSPEVIMRSVLPPFGFVQVPYGRSRPIDFRQSHCYAQHLTNDELTAFLAYVGVDLPERDFPFRADDVVTVADAMSPA